MNNAFEKQRQTAEELQEHLNDQMAFLASSAKSFDEGFEGESKRIATAIRVLVHDTKHSKSILSQLDLKDRSFWNTCDPENYDNLVSHSGLVVNLMEKNGATYRAFLDDGYHPPYETPFDEWWNQVIFVDSAKRKLSRRDLVLTVANQDGGAHVDASLDKTYAELSRNNALGWVYQKDDEPQIEMKGPEKAALRQICHEVLRTLNPDYRMAPVYPENSLVFGGMTVVVDQTLQAQQGACRNDSGVMSAHACEGCKPLAPTGNPRG